MSAEMIEWLGLNVFWTWFAIMFVKTTGLAKWIGLVPWDKEKEDA